MFRRGSCSTRAGKKWARGLRALNSRVSNVPIQSARLLHPLRVIKNWSGGRKKEAKLGADCSAKTGASTVEAKR